MTDFQKFHIYCDESCTQHQFTVIGCVFCHEALVSRLNNKIAEIQGRHGIKSEMKWNKVKPGNLAAYKEVVDLFVRGKNANQMHYYALVVNNSQMNHRLYNEGDKEIGFNKMLFQVLFQFVRRYRQRPRFYAYLDGRTTKHTPEKLRTMLNAKASKDFSIVHNPFRVCQFRPSEAEPLIQLADILSGAVGYVTNEMDLKTGAAAHKVNLSAYIRDQLRLTSLGMPTDYATVGFNLWHFRHVAYVRGSRAPRH